MAETVKDLRAKAKAAGIKGYSRMRKAQIEKALDEAEGYDAAANSAGCYNVAIAHMRSKLESFRKEVIGDCTLYLGDCLEILPTLGKVDAVVTSPPYDDIRAYGANWRFDWRGVIENLAMRIVPGGVLVWNVADQTVEGSETLTSFKQALHMRECGLRLHDTMIYIKEGVSFPDSNRYLPAFEYMFVASNGAPKTFNGLKDRKNKYGGAKIHGTDRQQDGSTTRKKRFGDTFPEYGLRYNWWPISNAYSGETAGHPAPMPYGMAAGHIQTWTEPGDIVLDPCLGSGTTLVACVRLGRRGIGIEIDEGYFDIACQRIREAYRQPDMFVPAPTTPIEQLSLIAAE